MSFDPKHIEYKCIEQPCKKHGLHKAVAARYIPLGIIAICAEYEDQQKNKETVTAEITEIAKDYYDGNPSAEFVEAIYDKLKEAVKDNNFSDLLKTTEIIVGMHNHMLTRVIREWGDPEITRYPDVFNAIMQMRKASLENKSAASTTSTESAVPYISISKEQVPEAKEVLKDLLIPKNGRVREAMNSLLTDKVVQEKLDEAVSEVLEKLASLK